MPLGTHFDVLGSGKAPNVCFLLHPNKKQILGALPDPSTPKCIPKGILVGGGNVAGAKVSHGMRACTPTERRFTPIAAQSSSFCRSKVPEGVSIGTRARNMGASSALPALRGSAISSTEQSQQQQQRGSSLTAAATARGESLRKISHLRKKEQVSLIRLCQLVCARAAVAVHEPR